MQAATPVEEMLRWLVRPQVRALTLAEFLPRLAARLGDQGISVCRMSCSVRTKHPEVFVENAVWNDRDGGFTRSLAHDRINSPLFQQSPAPPIYEGAVDEIRISLLDPEQHDRFPICRDLLEDGVTDYLALGLPFSDGLVSFLSLATRAPGGFSDEAMELLHAIRPGVSAFIELRSAYNAQGSLLRTYLGRNASERVMQGAFRRGRGELIDAVVWSCDLRGFTGRVDSSPVDEVLRDLDTYFAMVTEPIHEVGGEVLKFVGDAILAIFPIDEAGRARACRAAFGAACQAVLNGREENARRREQVLPSIDFGIGLNVGQVMYGNIGAATRLDFTVIGAAVNEACRIESLCKEVGTPLLFTGAVAKHLDPSEVESTGTRELRGVSTPIELFRWSKDGS